MLQHIATDGAWYLYGGRGAVNGSSWDWSQRNYPNQDGSYVEFNTSARAPIFYDRNNTAYYVNPDGFSNFGQSNGQVVTITKTGSAPGNNSTMLVTNSYGNHSWGITGEFRIEANGGTDRPSILFSNGYDSNTWSCGYGYADSSYFRINHDHGHRNGSWGTTDFYVDRSGNSYSNGSSRAPIFYDQNNTAYWLDPNATFNLNLNGAGVTFTGDTSGIHVLNAEGVSSNVRVGAAWGRPGVYNNPYFCIGAESFIEFRIGNVQNGFVQSSYLEMAGSVRGPIFYDSNNTGFFVDPNGSSRTNEFLGYKVRGDTNGIYTDNSGWWTHDPYGQGWGKPHGSFRSLEVSTSGNFSTEPAMFRIHQWGSGSCEWYKPQGTTVYLRETPGGGGSWFTRHVIERYTENTESFRAPIFYDTNNTGYYIDPNGFTEIYGGLRMSGAHGNTTSRLRLLPGNNGAGTGLCQLQMWVSEPGNTWDWGGVGFNVDNTYHDGSGPYYFSRPNTSFGSSYFRFSTAGNLYLNTMNSSGSNWRVMEWYTGGTVYANDYLTGGNSLRAPIFYDSNNTAYYTDPTGYSQMSSGEFNNYVRVARIDFIGTGGNSGQGTNAYNIFQEGGGWSYPYPDLRIAYHTGIKLGANAGSYEGTRVYSDYDMSDLCIQLAGSSNYSFKYKWMYVADVGFYTGTNSAHWYPNNSTYGTWRMDGYKNSYTGILQDVGNTPVTGMFDTGGNGGCYYQSGRWMFYHYFPYNCTGVNTSSTSPSYGMYVSGGIYSTGNIVAYSDARKKTNIVTIESALEKILKLRGVYYNRIMDEAANITTEMAEKRQTGLIAQETVDIFPEVVTYDDVNDEFGISYGSFAGLFIEGFKEQNEIIKKQSEEIKELKEILNKLIFNNKE